MKYLIVNNGIKYQIASLIESYKNNIQVELIPEQQKRKLKLEQQIYSLPNLTASNLAKFNQKTEGLSSQIDIELLSELIEDYNKNHTFLELTQLYFGDKYGDEEKTSMLFTLASNTIIFNDYKNGNFSKRTPEEQSKQRLSLEKKQKEQQIYNSYYEELIKLQNPHFDDSVNIIKLINKPDKNSISYQALHFASKFLGISPFELCYKAGIISDLADFHIKTFMLEHFPNSLNYESQINTPNNHDSNNIDSITLPNDIETNLHLKIFSIDDSTTTEIDDAFSIQKTDTNTIVGVHIASPALHPSIAELVSENISTIYFPGHKITMLPQNIISQFSLNENKETPVVSIYFVIDNEFNILEYYSKVEIVKISHNLRIEELELIFNQNNLDIEHNYPYESELKLLYKFANKLEENRGKPSTNNLVTDYLFSFDDNERIIIKPRIRGNPIDKLVSELMILANCTWGRMLTNAFIPAIYRVKQPNYPVKMTLNADSHTGLNVSYYTWSTSPLRRSADYINQHQIINLVTRQKNYYSATNPILLDVVESFDTKYAKYIDFQNKMERYWSLKYLIQENISELTATFIYKSKVQLDGIPIEINTENLINPKPKGSQIKVKIFNINIVNLTFEFKILEIISDNTLV